MTRPLRCLITDDEPFARKGLQGYVEKIAFLELRGTCANAQELGEQLAREPADLLLLDIEMPGLSGLEFLRRHAGPRPQVILTTAFEQYALAGFELDVLDYLLKPISFDRFLRAVNKAYDYFRLRDQPAAEPADYFFVRAEGRLEKVVFAELLAVEGLENYVTLHTLTHKVITHSSLKAVLARLPAGEFFQTHKSYAVARRHVRAVEGNTLLVGALAVPISKVLRPQVFAWLGLA